jgi:adenine deaminase
MAEIVAASGISQLPDLRSDHVNQFNCLPKKPADFEVIAENADAHEDSNGVAQRSATDAIGTSNPGQRPKSLQVIECTRWTIDHQHAGDSRRPYSRKPGCGRCGSRDILKITVVNRYQDSAPAVAFIKNFSLKKGAIASSVGHDSHNIIAVGCDDESICRAVNLVIAARGGLSAVGGSVKPPVAAATHRRSDDRHRRLCCGRNLHGHRPFCERPNWAVR